MSDYIDALEDSTTPLDEWLGDKYWEGWREVYKNVSREKMEEALHLVNRHTMSTTSVGTLRTKVKKILFGEL